MQVDHIDPKGGDGLDNLCLSCWNCNNHKRSAVLISDPETSTQVPLFHPRRDRWTDHFEWVEDATLVHGLTPVGRATIARLKMNRPALVIARHRWVQGGYHPPEHD
jgi:HNH endonuclease